MTLTKLKQATIACLLLGMLTACGSKTDQLIDVITEQSKVDEPAIAQLQETFNTQMTFMESFDDLLKDAAKKYEKVEEVRPELQAEATTLKQSFETAHNQLVLTEEEMLKLEKLLTKAEKEADYESVKALTEAYQAYKTALESVVTGNVELMTTYESFLTDITADMPFKDLEELIGSLNQALATVNEAYEIYSELATQFQSLLTAQLN